MEREKTPRNKTSLSSSKEIKREWREYIHIHIIEEDDYYSDEMECLSEGINKEGVEVEIYVRLGAKARSENEI